MKRTIPGALCALIGALGCGGDDTDSREDKGCSVTAQSGCALGQVCEEVEGGNPACYAPVTFSGKVADLTNSKPIANAHVVARDANNAAVSHVALSGPDGVYKLQVPAKRDKSGKPVQVSYTLRADASGYNTFPQPPREAVPIDVSTATGTPLDVNSAATDIGLLAVPDAGTLGRVSGKVLADFPGGTLVVAGGATGVADFDGTYTVFNVPAGDRQVSGYAAGLQLAPATAKVTAGAETPNVDLALKGAATAVVSGKVDIVNPGDGKDTSVILVVEETFAGLEKENGASLRGEAPRGLREAGVSGEFSIKDVPDGKYVVLAAFENDFLVRDPDTSIGGTEIVHITVASNSLPIAEGFKVTGALGVKSPGATKLEEVSGTPTFSWEDDSSEDHYELRVYDALGNKIWEDDAVPGVSGSDTVSATYAGPALKPGMIYQFRATSIGKSSGGKPATPISQTEDLRGVFIYK